ncbi:aminopeptidase N C-terminal domain-containing protein [Phenylobacterium sp.]|uniref:aminopeptidase N C-terminal domain-containing protein n=1 Tax=Phenylobacterium sp. TaxID=1871053 RepID=UPI003BAC5636
MVIAPNDMRATLLANALCALSNDDTPLRRDAFSLFYERHCGQPLAIDKWFKAVTRAPPPSTTFSQLRHTRTWTSATPLALWRSSGAASGRTDGRFTTPRARLRFLADRLIAADRIGAGCPSYIMGQIDQWRRYDDDRRALMEAALRRVAETPDMSPALNGVVQRTLAAPNK